MKWIGAAGICVNAQNQLLMVREKTGKGASSWSVPTGGVETGETNEQCAIREMAEETGYAAEIRQKLKVKKGTYEKLGIIYEVHYFLMVIIGGQLQLQDPDQQVMEIAWKSLEELDALPLTYPEDRDFLAGFLQTPAVNQP